MELEGHFSERPKAGFALKVLGLERDEEKNVLNDSQDSSTGANSEVLKHFCALELESLGRLSRLFGRVIRVFPSFDGTIHPHGSVALVQQGGSSYFRKVVSSSALQEGQYLDARGVFDRVPASRCERDRNEPMPRAPLYCLEFHVLQACVRQKMSTFSAEVVRILRPCDRDCFAQVELRVWEKDCAKTFKTALVLPRRKRLQAGERLTLTAFCSAGGTGRRTVYGYKEGEGLGDFICAPESAAHVLHHPSEDAGD